jgi:acyl carrier protein
MGKGILSIFAVTLLSAGGWLSMLALPAARADRGAGASSGPDQAAGPTSRPAGSPTAAVPTTAPAARDQVVAKVTESVANLLGKKDAERDQIKPSATWEELGADDLDQVEIILDCEQTFGLTIPDDQAAKLKTVGQLMDYILAHKAAPVGK